MKLVAVTLLLCAFFSGPAQSAQSASPPAVAYAVSDQSIRLQGIDGQTYDIAEMRGHVALVSFGATWCVPCSAELHALEELKLEYKDKPVKFFWVSIESAEAISNKDLQKYARSRRLSFPVLRDPAQTTFGQFTKRVRLPLVVFYDKEGRLDSPVHFGMGVPDLYKSRMRERLNKLL